MNIYRKIRVEAGSNGELRQRGILVMNNGGALVYATAQDNIAFPADPGQVRMSVIIRAEHVACAQAQMPVSFATITRSIGQYFPFLAPFRVHLDGEAVPVQAGSVIDLGEIFPAQPAEGAAQAQTGPDSEVAIKSGYTSTEIYSGFGGYHSNQRCHRFNTPLTADRPWRIGVELEVYARSDEARRTITGARSNWFQCESDSSLHDSAFGGSARAIELKTIPLRACDAKSVDFWSAPMARLAQLARSKGSSTTGLHVHIGKEILGDSETERQKTLAKLNLFYVYMVEDDPDAHQKNVIICGREHGYSGCLEGAKSEVVDFAKECGLKTMLGGMSERGQQIVSQALNEKCRSQRWDINIGNYNSYGTIEFRKGDGRISKTRMAGLVTWWEQMCLYCRNTPWNELDFNAFFRKVTSENPCVSYFFNQDEEA